MHTFLSTTYDCRSISRFDYQLQRVRFRWGPWQLWHCCITSIHLQSLFVHYSRFRIHIDRVTFCIKSLFLIIDEHRCASHCYIPTGAHHWGTLDSFANATAKQINKGFSNSLFLLLAAYRWCANVLAVVALDFIAIDFWVPRARPYAIRLDFLPLTLSPSRSRDYFCKLLINRHASPESVANGKGDIIPETTRWLQLQCLALHRAIESRLKLDLHLCGDLKYSYFPFKFFLLQLWWSPKPEPKTSL